MDTSEIQTPTKVTIYFCQMILLQLPSDLEINDVIRDVHSTKLTETFCGPTEPPVQCVLGFFPCGKEVGE